jgi:DNA repair exonuclease SbcCD ATPase subunit
MIHKETLQRTKRPTRPNGINQMHRENNQKTNTRPKQPNRIKGTLPHHLELIDNKFAITWLRRNTEGDRGEQQLKELQEKIKEEYGLDIGLTEEKEKEINQLKQQHNEERKERRRKERIEEIMKGEWEEKEKKPEEKPKERRETFYEKKARRIEENKTRITEEMKITRTKKQEKETGEQERKKDERKKENLEKYRNQINNFQTQNRIYNVKQAKKPVMEQIETITLEETKYPFVTMQTNKDGHCGFTAIARHYYPHLRTCNKELIKYARDLKTASKNTFWTTGMKTQKGN